MCVCMLQRVLRLLRKSIGTHRKISGVGVEHATQTHTSNSNPPPGASCSECTNRREKSTWVGSLNTANQVGTGPPCTWQRDKP